MRGFIILTLLLLLGHSTRSSAADTYLSSSRLKLDGQTGWFYYVGADAPEGGYIAHLPAGTTTVQATVALPASLPAGRQDVYIKVIDYDNFGEVTVSAAGVSTRGLTSDRDDNRNWTGPLQLNLPSAASSLSFTFHKTKPAATPTKCLVMAVYVTADTSKIVYRNGDVISFHYPSPSEYDLSSPIKGNLLANSSFEVGLGRGWGLSGPRRPATLSEMWDPTTGFHGTSSVKFNVPKGAAWFEIISRPFHVRPNKRHTLSAYVKSNARNWASIFLRNTITPPEGHPDTQALGEGFLISTPDTWQRIVLSDILLEYPDSEFQIVLWAQAYDGGTVWFDNVQLEEGDVTVYRPSSSMEVGLQTSVPGNLYFDEAPVTMDLRVSNGGATTTTTNVAFEIYDYKNVLVRDGSVSVTVAGQSTVSQPLNVDPGLRGIFRVKVYIPGVADSEEEVVFSIIPRPTNVAKDTTSRMGTHLYSGDWEGRLMQNLGIKWNRASSPAAWFRWALAEPREGEYNWSDGEVEAAIRNGITLLANVGEHAPSWAHRHYFGLSDISGNFRVGEQIVGNTGASGTVSVILGNASPTGPALQLAAVQGTLAQGQTIRGATSGATATIATAVFPNTPDLNKWEAYVTAVVSHHKNNVKHWEVWNEPNQDSEIPKPNSSPSFYAELLRRAMIRIKQADPTAVVVGMGGVYSPDWVLSVLNMLPADWRNYIDAVSVHLYPGNGGLADAFRTRVTEPFNLPIWNTEVGAWDLGFYAGRNANVRHGIQNLQSFKDADRFYRGTLIEAESVGINFIQCMGAGFERYFYYDARIASSPSAFLTHPTMIDFDDSIKAKGIAYAILGSFLDHSRGLGRVTVSEPQVEVYLVEKNGVPIAGLFSTDRAPRWVDISANAKVYDLMGNPVAVTGGRIPCGRTPVLLVGEGLSTATFRNALSSAAISPRVDTSAPALAISVGPRGPVFKDEPLYLRWFAIDDQDVPAERDPNATLYSYRLAGRDTAWTEWSQLTQIDIAGLAVGNYNFEVRAKDRTGNESPVVSREIVVLPAKPSAPRNIRVTSR